MGSLELPQVLTAREYGYEQLRRLRRQGEVHRFRRGAYRRPTRAQKPWEQRRELFRARCVAASKQLTGLYAFSHGTAAGLFD